MTGQIRRSEILTEPQRRRRWSPSEKLAMVDETCEPGITVSLVARRNSIQPNQLVARRKPATQGALTATSARGAVVAASEYRAVQNQVGVVAEL